MTLSLAAPATPFKGLSPFDESELDALFFFGREREREVVVANLMASRLTVLFGPSGVGKTSLLRAGVAYALRSVPDAEVVVFSAWPVDPLHGLRAAIVDTAGIEDGGEPLHELLAAASGAVGGDLYVILDQFEEYFLYHDPDEDGALADELAEAIRRPGLRANFLLGMREDALAKLDAFKGRIPGLFSNSLRLDRLDRAAGEAATVGPINAYNALVEPEDRVEIEPALVSRLLDQVSAGRVGAAEDGAGDRIEAPYLQLVLERLWETEARAGSRRLRLATLEELHGASRIVHEHLDRAMAGLSPREQDAAAAMYNHLVTPSGTKIAHVVADLAGYAALDEDEAAAVLRRLSDERIVRAGENGGSNRYEIYHDVLADAVVAWRTRYQAERRLEQQRLEAERRHRGLVRVLALAFAALAVVAAVAVYALVQRAEARHQTAVAKLERTRAEHAAIVAKQKSREANRQRRGAEHQTKIAKLQTRKANRSARIANVQKRLATAAKLEALSAEAAAKEQRRKADRLREAADRARAVAQNQTVLARRQTRAAKSAKALATHRARVVRAKQLEADARAFVTTDPEKSVQYALAAVRAYRRAGLPYTRGLEEAVREAYLALRLRAVLPSPGRARVAEYSPNGSLVAVAGEKGARIYDLDHRFAVRRLLPPVALGALAFSPDSRLLAGAGEDGAVHLWDTGTGAPVAALRHDGGPVRTVAFSPDGQMLASGGLDGTARVWSVAGGLPLAVFEPRAAARRGIRSVSFSPDGQRLLVVASDRFARVYDIAGKKLVHELDNTTTVKVARFSHDGRLIATAGGSSTDHSVKVWNASTGVWALPPLAGSGQFNDLDFNQNDALLATAGSDDTLARVWNLSEHASQAIFPGHVSGVVTVRFSPDSRSVLTAGRDGKAILWASLGGFVQGTLAGHHAAVNEATFSPDGTSMLTAGDDGTARIWDATRDSSSTVIANHGAFVNVVAFSPDGRTILSGGNDGTARLTRGSDALVLRHDGAVTSGEFSKDGRLVITGSDDKTARIWRASNGAPLETFLHGASVRVARLSPNGLLALTGGSDGVARIWSVDTGRQLHELKHAGPINDAHFSRDGLLVVTASSDGTGAIWRVSDGRRLHTLSGHTGPVLAAVFSPGGRRVATASTDGTARTWNARSGSRELELKGHSDDVSAVAFSPDGRRLATASLDKDARIWNAATGEQLNVLSIHSGPVSDVAFSSDGRWLATAGPTAVGIWDALKRDWSLVYLVRGHNRIINDVEFSPRGWRIVSGSRDGTVRSFNCVVCGRTPQLAKLASARLHQIVHVKP